MNVGLNFRRAEEEQADSMDDESVAIPRAGSSTIFFCLRPWSWNLPWFQPDPCIERVRRMLPDPDSDRNGAPGEDDFRAIHGRRQCSVQIFVDS